MKTLDEHPTTSPAALARGWVVSPTYALGSIGETRDAAGPLRQ